MRKESDPETKGILFENIETDIAAMALNMHLRQILNSGERLMICTPMMANYVLGMLERDEARILGVVQAHERYVKGEEERDQSMIDALHNEVTELKRKLRKKEEAKGSGRVVIDSPDEPMTQEGINAKG